jgi:hypothetical protein
MRPPPRDAKADLKWGLAPGCSVPGLNLIQPVGYLSTFPDSHLIEARLLKIGGIPAAAYVAGRLPITENHGARQADFHGGLFLGESGEIRVIRGLLFGDLLPAESGEVHLHRAPSPLRKRLARASFFGHGRNPICVAARIRRLLLKTEH